MSWFLSWTCLPTGWKVIGNSGTISRGFLQSVFGFCFLFFCCLDFCRDRDTKRESSRANWYRITNNFFLSFFLLLVLLSLFYLLSFFFCLLPLCLDGSMDPTDMFLFFFFLFLCQKILFARGSLAVPPFVISPLALRTPDRTLCDHRCTLRSRQNYKINFKHLIGSGN